MGIGAWEQNPFPSVGIAIPHTGLVFAEWAMGLKKLIFTPGAQILVNRGYPIDQARNQLVDQAKKQKCTHIFFLDSDVVPPDHAIYTLLSDNLPIVSGIYRNKRDRYPAAWRLVPFPKPGEKYTALTGYDSVLTDVDVIGMGCCLVDMKVFDRLPFPWFEWTMDIDMSKGVSEDFRFCELAKEKGFRIKIDNRVQCAHEVLGILPVTDNFNEPVINCAI